MPFFATWQHRFGAAGSLETLARRDRPLISTLACPISAEQLSSRYYSSATYGKVIDRPAMRLVNVATKKSRPIQRIEVFTKTVGVELP